MEDILKGRIIRKRKHGDVIFLDLRNKNGVEQLALRKSYFGDDYESFKDKIHIGDIVEVSGDYFTSNTGTNTLGIHTYDVLTQCHSPSKIKTRPNIDTRRNNRGFDLLTSQESLERFNKIGKLTSVLRMYLYEQGFIEMDTGILRNTTDTSKARDFTTIANWNKQELYIRKSTEQKLKQLMVGGLEDIFELGKVFRNEDVGKEFSPEFTALELYKTFGVYEDLLDLMKGMLKRIDNEIGIPRTKPSEFEEIGFYDYINGEIGMDSRVIKLEELNDKIPFNKRKNYPMDEESRGYFLHDLFESLIQEERDRNITIIGYPKEITVLSKRFENDPSLSEEFRMFVRGGSYCYGCTELIDYEEQKKRIEEQTKFWGKNEKKLDDNFIEMLKIGLPPCAGLGLSLERLQAVYLDLDDVRDVIAFPLKK
ncbi:hypothetical protein CL617_05660 [archaeon]|nr:hypothetical protein [archaeon]